MSLPTWTPAALASEAGRLSGKFWRMVEAQHFVSTLKLVDTIEEQALLEELAETVKPHVPPECAEFDYLLSTPFRYGSPYPGGSRFRRAGYTDGVYYCSVTVGTAVAEMAFYRLLFYAESPGLPFSDRAAEYTAFAAEIETQSAIDLTAEPFASQRRTWCDPVSYKACQALADAGREAGIEAIRYESVRDPGGGINLAVLRCRAFARREPVARETWRMRISRTGIAAVAEFPRRMLGYPIEVFGNDPRIAAFLQLQGAS
jgi:hypothetical protein